MQDPEVTLLQSQAASEDSQTPPSTTSGGGGSFDCNICLELAQDPVVTLCGHLFCWPCLYRWLQMHLICQECPVYKAGVEEEKVIPLYGRGKVGSVDPRTKTVPGMNIPHRLADQRPDTAQQSDQQYQHHGFNFMAGPGGPTATARFGNITLSGCSSSVLKPSPTHMFCVDCLTMFFSFPSTLVSISGCVERI
jgi:E3 ubiquitin-protein ligase RNF5